MARLVEPKLVADAPTSPSSAAADYLERVAKYIPGEILAAYVALNGFVAVASPGRRVWLYALSFVVCLVFTPLYLWKMAVPGKPKALHLFIATAAFALWAYSLGGLFTELKIHDPVIASILLVIFSIMSGFAQPTAPATMSRAAGAA
jgi:hypothetical protein